MQILSLLTLVVFGPTLHGKSSFIRYLGGKVPDSEIGDIGRSVTSTPNSYLVNITWPDAQQPLEIIDFPGMYQTEQLFTDEEIAKMIREMVEKRKLRKLGALLVFNSLAADTLKIRRSLLELFNIMGDIRSSVIAVFTKTDLVEETSVKRQKAMSLCTELRLQCLMWSNLAESKDMETQLTNFRSALERVTPFSTSKFKEIDRAISIRAKSICDRDSGRNITSLLNNETLVEKNAYNCSDLEIPSSSEPLDSETDSNSETETYLMFLLIYVKKVFSSLWTSFCGYMSNLPRMFYSIYTADPINSPITTEVSVSNTTESSQPTEDCEAENVESMEEQTKRYVFEHYFKLAKIEMAEMNRELLQGQPIVPKDPINKFNGIVTKTQLN